MNYKLKNGILVPDRRVCAFNFGFNFGFGGTTAPAGEAEEEFDAVAAYKAACELYMDFGNGNTLLYSATNKTGAVSNGTVVRSIVPEVAKNFDHWKETSGSNLLEYDTDAPIRGGGTLKVQDQAASSLSSYNAAGTVLTNPALITASLYYGCVQFRLNDASTFDVPIFRFDSNNRVVVEVDENSTVIDVSVQLVTTGGTNDTTIKKATVEHGDIVTVSWFFDGTTLRWKFDGDAAGSSEADYTLDTVGTSAIAFGDLNASEFLDISVKSAGKALPEGVSAEDFWNDYMVAHHDALVAALS